MKKKLSILCIAIFCIAFSSCGGKQSASSVAQKWCELNGKVFKAADDAEKKGAKAALDKYENDMEAK